MNTQRPPVSQVLAQAWELIRAGDVPRAVQACQFLNHQYPESADGWFAGSYLALQIGGADHALQCIEMALKLKPGNPHWQLQKSACLHATGRNGEAAELVGELASRPHSDPRMWGEIGMQASRLQQYDLAAHAFEKAVELDPGQGRYHFNLATIYRFRGELGKAEESCAQALALNDSDHDALYLRSSLRKQTEESNHVPGLMNILDSLSQDDPGEALLCYSLAKEFEDLGDFKNSFRYLRRGAGARRRTLQYDPQSDLEFIRTIIEVYNREMLAAPRPGNDSTEPIFVLGLPRTGTTLVERILSSHDQVTSAGELTHFTRTIASMAQEVAIRNPMGQGANRGDMVRMTSLIDFNELGSRYLELARPPGLGGAHFIDKFPQNTINIGAIRLALPRAKIVLLQRHPMDACYSMYKQVFTEIYQFSYDLEELGQYFIAHQSMLEHWLEVCGDAIHVVRYEDLVSEPRQAVESLLDFCGLDWQDQCLEFHRNTQASTTASASQVRQKIYSSSVGMWKNYQAELEPLRKMLEDAGMLHY